MRKMKQIDRNPFLEFEDSRDICGNLCTVDLYSIPALVLDF